MTPKKQCYQLFSEGNILGVGDSNGAIEIWDVTKTKRVRTMGGLPDRVPVRKKLTLYVNSVLIILIFLVLGSKMKNIFKMCYFSTLFNVLSLRFWVGMSIFLRVVVVMEL